MIEKDKTKNYQELLYKKESYYEKADDEEKKRVFDFAERYKAFINECKTERNAQPMQFQGRKSKALKNTTLVIS